MKPDGVAYNLVRYIVKVCFMIFLMMILDWYVAASQPVRRSPAVVVVLVVVVV